MIIIIPEKVFIKKAKKMVPYKDFIIADATDDGESELTDMGNRTQCPELTPTPVLRKIAMDPDSAEAKIKARNLKRYIEQWVEDEGFLMKILYFADMMCTQFENSSEDLNIFIVLRKKDYQEYAGYMKDSIDRYFEGYNLTGLIGKKTEKSEWEPMLKDSRPREFWGRLRKAIEKRRKDFDKSKLAQIYHEQGI